MLKQKYINDYGLLIFYQKCFFLDITVVWTRILVSELEYLLHVKTPMCPWHGYLKFSESMCLHLVTEISWVVMFYVPGLKGPPGASSNRIVRPSVCLSVRNSVPLTNKVQYLKFG